MSKWKLLVLSVFIWAASALPGGAQVVNSTASIARFARAIMSQPTIGSQGPLARQIPAAAIRPDGLAPSLSIVFVYAVRSQNCGVEYMTTRGQISTVCDHGGAFLTTAVLEIGYGSNPIAWMNGAQLPQSANFSTTAVCVVSGFYSWPCPPGYTVVGYLREYDVSGQQGGFFQYQNTSTNFPNNSLSTSISIL